MGDYPKAHVTSRRAEAFVFVESRRRDGVSLENVRSPALAPGASVVCGLRPPLSAKF